MIKFNKLLLSFLFLGCCSLSAMEGPEEPDKLEEMQKEGFVECSICYKKFASKDIIRGGQLFGCGDEHVYCAECIAHWIRRKAEEGVRARCPFCRAFLQEKTQTDSPCVIAAIKDYLRVFPLRSFELLEAVNRRDLKKIDELLKLPYIDVNIGNPSALCRAVWNGDEASVARLLEDPRVDVNFFQGHPLSSAIFNGDRAIAERLLADPRIDVNMCSSFETPIFKAVRCGHMEIFERLLADPRVDLNILTPKGETALMMMFWTERNFELIKKLLEDPRVDKDYICARSKFGTTALMHAALSGHGNLIELLLADARVDEVYINMQDNNGNTALMQAAFFGRFETVMSLLADPRVDLSLRNKSGHTALMLAQKRIGQKSVFELIAREIERKLQE